MSPSSPISNTSPPSSSKLPSDPTFASPSSPQPEFHLTDAPLVAPPYLPEQVDLTSDTEDSTHPFSPDEEARIRARAATTSRRSTVHSTRTVASNGFYSSEDLSPKSAFSPSLRRPTVPDIASPSILQAIDFGRHASLAELHVRNMESDSSLDHRRPRARGSLDSLDIESPPDGAFYNLPDHAPVPQLSAEYGQRPSLLQIQSSSSNSAVPLMADISGANTPVTPSGNPFEEGRRSSLDSLSEEAHYTRPAPPRIQVNNSSVPNTPDPGASSDIDEAYMPSFTPQIVSRTSLPERRSSLAQRKNGRLESVHSADSAYAGGYLGSVGSGANTPGTKTTISQRRSARMRDSKGRKKGDKGEKESREIKQMNRKPFQSTRLKGEIYKPWLEEKDPAQRTARWITLASIFLGFVIMGVLCWDGYRSVPNLGKTCPILDEDWSKGIDSSIWTQEVRTDGYGHGSFAWTTSSPNNSFVKDGTLYIVPTLSSDTFGSAAISNGYTLNLTADGTCTSTNVSECVAVSNSSHLTVINPVQSARLTTRHSLNVRYGKIEVVAKFPTGDWLWPSITMLPVNETYGAWPRSGQIDIVTGRGNNASYPNRGVDYAQSDLHWGPTTDLDRLYMTWGYREQRRTYFNQKYHTYGLEWNDKYMWTYVDSKVAQTISLRFKKDSFWERGKFPGTITNTTTGDVIKLVNPWISSEDNSAPFDQPFYLVLDLMVGGTDGWFPDGDGGKPWLDNSGTAMSDFWNSKDKWWNNWPKSPTERGFAIKSVKIWKTC